MKIDANQLPFEGLILTEEIQPLELDLDTEIISFSGPIKVRAEVSRITNAITVFLDLSGLMNFTCSRCLENRQALFEKNFRLNYQVNPAQPIINLDPDIREEIILDYAIKPLCKPDCLGLCPKCGENLNEGGCSCGTTKKKTF